MVSLENFRPHLRDVLRRFDAPALLSEAAWVVAYATASQQRHLPAQEFLRPILNLLEFAHVPPPPAASEVTFPISLYLMKDSPCDAWLP